MKWWLQWLSESWASVVVLQPEEQLSMQHLQSLNKHIILNKGLSLLSIEETHKDLIELFMLAEETKNGIYTPLFLSKEKTAQKIHEILDNSEKADTYFRLLQKLTKATAKNNAWISADDMEEDMHLIQEGMTITNKILDQYTFKKK